MASSLPQSLESLIKNLSHLPGIGKKTAKRLGLYILKQDDLYSNELAASIIAVKEKIKYCKYCNNFTESDICLVCSDKSRNFSLLCVVENPSDIILFE